MPVTPLCALISVGASEFARCSHVLDETAGIEPHFAGERTHGFEVEFFSRHISRNIQSIEFARLFDRNPSVL